MENQDVSNLIKEGKKSNNIVKFILLAIGLFAIIGIIFYLSNTDSSLLNDKKASESGGICSGVDVAFFPGGNETDSFASVVYKGAKAAEKDLGANVKYFWSDWDSSKMVSQFMDAIATSPDAIAIMGHPGSEALGPLVDEAERKNIIVTSQNVDLPDIREKYSSKGFGYVGQSVYDSGLTVANAIIRKYDPKKGAEAIVFGVSSSASPSRYQRTKGGIDGLKNNGLVVHEISMSPEVEKDLESLIARKMISDALAKYPNAKIIIADHGALTASISSHLSNLGKKPGEIIVAGFDLSVNTVKGIKDGYVGLVLDQQPYLQGYLPILQSCLTKKYGFSGLYINTGVGLIDSSNIDLVSGLALEKIR